MATSNLLLTKSKICSIMERGSCNLHHLSSTSSRRTQREQTSSSYRRRKESYTMATSDSRYPRDTERRPPTQRPALHVARWQLIPATKTATPAIKSAIAPATVPAISAKTLCALNCHPMLKISRFGLHHGALQPKSATAATIPAKNRQGHPSVVIQHHPAPS